MKPFCVVLFDCPRATAKTRFIIRARGDDTTEIFQKRYDEFVEKNAAVLEHYSGALKTVSCQ